MGDGQQHVVKHVVPFDQWSTVARCLREAGFTARPSSLDAAPVMEVTVRGDTADEQVVADIVRRFVPNPQPRSREDRPA